MKTKVGTVQELWRYPVKSMGGELLEQAEIEKHGLMGDRAWAIRDGLSDELTSVRKTPRLLQCAAEYLEEPESNQIDDDVPDVKITLPDGHEFTSRSLETDTLLSEYLQKPVSLWPLQPRSNWKFYQLKTMNGEASLKRQFNTKEALPSMASISWKKLLELSIFSTPLGRYYDIYPLHILTTNSVETLKSLEPSGDVQSKRFRPNLFIDSSSDGRLEEFDWVGGRLYIGDTVLKCESRTVRCLMPAQPQVGLGKDSSILRTLEKHTGRHLGINASVIKAGTIRHGDPVYWQPEAQYSVNRLLRPLSDRLRNAVIQATLKLVDKLGKG